MVGARPSMNPTRNYGNDRNKVSLKLGLIPTQNWCYLSCRGLHCIVVNEQNTMEKLYLNRSTPVFCKNRVHKGNPDVRMSPIRNVFLNPRNKCNIRAIQYNKKEFNRMNTSFPYVGLYTMEVHNLHRFSHVR